MICAKCAEEISEGEHCPECGEPPLLDGRYRLEASVGRGGTGTTYRARRVHDGRKVAVKELPVRRVDTVKAMELFEREASVLEQLDHPGVPDYFEDFSAGQGQNLSMYLVQEFIEGETLGEYVDRHRPSEEEVLEMLASILEIFEYLHGLEPPVIHRDVKPANMMRRRGSGDLVLVDFGSVREVLERSESGSSTVAGTFGYMAPEQFMGKAEPATDIYGLGATAVAILSGREPRELIDHERELQWKSAVAVDSAVEGLIEEMLRSEPSRRPQEPNRLRERIRRIERGESPNVPASESGSPSNALDLGSPPRELPTNFLERHGADARWMMHFGWLFGGIPVGLVAVVAVMAVTSGEAKAMTALAVFAGVGLLFGVIGAVFFVKGWSRKGLLEDVYRHGALAEAEITGASYSNYRTGGERAAQVDYRFELDSGTYTGRGDTFAIAVNQVDTDGKLPILYDPEDPSRNMGLLTRIPVD